MEVFLKLFFGLKLPVNTKDKSLKLKEKIKGSKNSLLQSVSQQCLEKMIISSPNITFYKFCAEPVNDSNSVIEYLSLSTEQPAWPKLYIPSTINTEKELLRTVIWADKKWAKKPQRILKIKSI